ncbi:MAG: hypothetical protein GY797_30340 [Deltaproteobacteria bacterium]|nr:hypothetical protein [Deltaproteobacteria bacterium]
MKFTLSYNLSDHGWADAAIQKDGKSYKINSISYLSDAFTDLSNAVKFLLQGSLESSCAFDHEPGRTKIKFIKSNENIKLQIYSFQNELRDESWEKGEIVFECDTTLKRLKSQYLNEADRILHNDGLKQYKEKWGYEFPKEIYNQIKNS